MQFAIISRGDSTSESKKSEAINQLLANGFIYNEAEPEVVIVIGGDGTVLRAFHTYQHRLHAAAFIAYNTGHLGFYSDWDDLDSLLNALLNGGLLTVEYPLIHIHATSKDTQVNYLALNDFTIKGIKGSIQVDVCFNGSHFESFKGDGLCVSSPSGSTGYNKSLGGAIVHPSMEIIQLSEMASINNRVYRTIGSSLIIPKHHVLTLQPKIDTYLLSVDHEHFTTDDVEQITCAVAKEKIKFLRSGSLPFWHRVKEAFISL